MKRCDVPAEYTAENGYRLCSDCYQKATPLVRKQMRRLPWSLKPTRCDRPIESYAEFRKRHGLPEVD